MVLFYLEFFKVSCWPHETLIKELRFSYAIFQVNIVNLPQKNTIARQLPANCQTIAHQSPHNSKKPTAPRLPKASPNQL